MMKRSMGAQTERPGPVAAGERWVCRLLLTGHFFKVVPLRCFVFFAGRIERVDFGLPLVRFVRLIRRLV